MASSQSPLPLFGYAYRPAGPRGPEGQGKQVLYLPYTPSYFDDEDTGPEIRNRVARRLLLDMLRGRPSSNIQEICLLAPARLVKKSPEHVLGNARAWLKGTEYEKCLGRVVCNDCFWKKKAPGLSVAGTRDYRNVRLCEFRVDGLQHVALMGPKGNGNNPDDEKESGSKRTPEKESGNPLKRSKKYDSDDEDSDKDSSEDEDNSADDSKTQHQTGQGMPPSKRVKAGEGHSAAGGAATAAGTVSQEPFKMLSNLPPEVRESVLRSDMLDNKDNATFNQTNREFDESKKLKFTSWKALDGDTTLPLLTHALENNKDVQQFMEYHNFDYYQVAGDRFHKTLPYDKENKTVYRLHVRVKVTEVTDDLLKLLRDDRFRFRLENVTPELWQKARANKEGPELSSVVSLAFAEQREDFLPQIPAEIFPKLASLDFGANRVDGKTLRSFQGLGHLTILRLRAYNSNIDDEDLRRFATITSLVELDISFCKHITNAGLRNLVSLKNLVTLSLNFCGDYSRSTVTGLELRPLASLQKLVKLNISGIRNAGQGLHYLKNLNNLEELICSETSISEEDMVRFCYLSTDGERKQNTNLQRLRVLDLWNTSFSGNILRHMAGDLSDFESALTNLKHLNLGGDTKITEGNLQYLPRLTKLEYLKLKSNLITDHNIRYVTALKELTDLDLESDNIRGGSLQKISQELKKLEILELTSDRIRDDNFKQLGKLEHLRVLNVAYCPGLTLLGVKDQFGKFEELKVLGIGQDWQEKDLVALEEMYPKLEIRRDVF